MDAILTALAAFCQALCALAALGAACGGAYLIGVATLFVWLGGILGRPARRHSTRKRK